MKNDFVDSNLISPLARVLFVEPTEERVVGLTRYGFFLFIFLGLCIFIGIFRYIFIIFKYFKGV